MNQQDLDHLKNEYESLQPDLWRYARRLLGDAADADDAMQEVYLRVYQNSSFTMQGQTRAYLYRITHHEAIAISRKKRGVLFDPQDMGDGVQQELAAQYVTRDSPSRNRETEFFDSVRGYVDALSEKDIQVLKARYWEDPPRPFEDIAQEHGMKVSGVKTRLQRALAKLRSRMADDNTDYARYAMSRTATGHDHPTNPE